MDPARLGLDVDRIGICQVGDIEALADLQARGGRSKTARAVVMELARQQDGRSKRDWQAMQN